MGEEDRAGREMAVVIQSAVVGTASQIGGRAGKLTQWLKPLPHSMRASVQIPRTHVNAGREWRSVCNSSLERKQGSPEQQAG